MSSNETGALVDHMSAIIRALLVAGRAGAPAEGQLPFNPLYFQILRTTAAAGALRPSALADLLSVPRSTISTALTALQRRGLLSTEPDPSDGRALIVRLSKEGTEVVEAILRQDRRNATLMLEGLAANERAEFVRLTGKVAQALSSGAVQQVTPQTGSHE